MQGLAQGLIGTDAGHLAAHQGGHRLFPLPLVADLVHLTQGEGPQGDLVVADHQQGLPATLADAVRGQADRVLGRQAGPDRFHQLRHPGFPDLGLVDEDLESRPHLRHRGRDHGRGGPRVAASAQVAQQGPDIELPGAGAADHRRARAAQGEDAQGHVQTQHLHETADDVGEHGHALVRVLDAQPQAQATELAGLGFLQHAAEEVQVAGIQGAGQVTRHHVQIRPVLQQEGRHARVPGGGGGVGEGAGVVVDAEQEEGGVDGRQGQVPGLDLLHELGDHGPRGLQVQLVGDDGAGGQVVIPDGHAQTRPPGQVTHLVQPLPTGDIGDDQVRQVAQIHLLAGAQAQQVPVDGDKVPDRRLDLAGQDALGLGVEHARGDQGGQGIEIGIDVGGGGDHGRTPAPLPWAWRWVWR